MIIYCNNYDYNTKEWYEDKLKEAKCRYNIIKTALEHASLLGIEINDNTLDILTLAKRDIEMCEELLNNWLDKNKENK